ncbi:MAG TPA: hypothetical protein V6D10_12720 [Trichocoleus sp.]|jgi:hypothetical protein
MTIGNSRLLLTVSLSLLALISCTQPRETTAQPPVSANPTSSTTPVPSPGRDLTPLFSKIWRVTNPPSQPASGSIFVFLPNGTLLQTSCVETYAIFGWTIDKDQPQVLQVSENGQPAYTAEIVELTNSTLRLQRQLIPSNETQMITLTAVEQEFVCPDLPK